MKQINVLLAVLVSLAVFVGVFEVGLRLLGMGPPKTLNQFDATVGWVKAPERIIDRNHEEFEVTYTLNKYGLRDDNFLSPTKPEGTTRVLALGDSFTLGYSVEREDLFVDHLEKWWRAEDRQVEVVNAGTEGYSTDQEVAWLEEYGKEYKPDLVLLFAYENDIFYNGQDHYLRFPKPRFNAAGEPIHEVLEDPGPGASTAIGHLLREKQGLKTFTTQAAPRPILREFGPLLTDPPSFLADSHAGTRGAFRALRASVMSCRPKWRWW